MKPQAPIVRVRAPSLPRRLAGLAVAGGFLAMLLISGPGPRAFAAPARPNVLLILADDFGFGSLGCYGAPAGLKTPNLDRLAREGRRFTQAYAPGSVCSPTRYGLLTGRYYWRTGVKDGEVLPATRRRTTRTNRRRRPSSSKVQ